MVVENYGDPYCLNCGYRAPVAVRETVVDEVVRGGKRYTKRRFVKRRGQR